MKRRKPCFERDLEGELVARYKGMSFYVTGLVTSGDKPNDLDMYTLMAYHFEGGVFVTDIAPVALYGRPEEREEVDDAFMSWINIIARNYGRVATARCRSEEYECQEANQ